MDKLKSWTLPNPNSEGPKYFLPMNFSWETTYKLFCKDYKEINKLEHDPLCWGTYHEFYTKKFDTIKKLIHKTDYLYCKYNLQSIQSLAVKKR